MFSFKSSLLALLLTTFLCVNVQAQKAKVLVLTGPGGHRSASNHVIMLLKKAGISYAEVDFSAFSDWTFDQTLELLEKDPESSTRFYDDYYKKAVGAKSIADLPFAEWHFALRFLAVLNVVQPEVIYTAYPISLELIEKLNLNGKIRNLPIGESPTDYNMDPYWVKRLVEGATMVFPPSLDWMLKSMSLGTPAGKLMLAGIPTNISFDKILTDAEEDALWKSLDFNKDVFTVFIGGGNGGVGEYGKMLSSIKKEFSPTKTKIQVIFAVGSNQNKFDLLKEAAKKLPANIKVTPLGYKDNISDYMAISNLIAGKGGGLTTTEVCKIKKKKKNGEVVKGKPFLIVVPAFGVEAGNVDYFVNKKMAETTTVPNLGKNIRRHMENPKIGESMMENQATIDSINRPSLIIEWIKAQLEKIAKSGEVPYIAKANTTWVYQKLKLQMTKNEKPFLSYADIKTEDLLSQYERTKFQVITSPIKMAITVDDIPGGVGEYTLLNRRETLASMIAVFKKHNVPQVFGFVNGRGVDQTGDGILKDWIAAGYPLGNHTEDHLSLTESSAQKYIDNIGLTEERLAKLGVRNHYFRYPFLQEGDTPAKRRRVLNYLEENDYKIAPVTVDVTDYLTNDKYLRAVERNGNTGQILSAAVEQASRRLKQSRTLAKKLFNRDINHVLLLHLAEVHVELLDQILTQFEKEGVQFVSLDEALTDPVYNTPRHRTAETMGNFLEEMAYETGLWTDDQKKVHKCGRKLSSK